MTFLTCIRRRIEIRRNRLRHPDLVRREAEGGCPMAVAQEMLSRDRERLEVEAEAYGTSVTIRFPTLGDYYVEPRRPIWPSGGTRRTVSQ